MEDQKKSLYIEACKSQRKANEMSPKLPSTTPAKTVRRSRSRKGQRRKTTMQRVDKNAYQLATMLSHELGIPKIDVISFALIAFAEAAHQTAIEQENAEANKSFEETMTTDVSVES